MADKTITDLTALATPASTDVLAIVDVAANETKKIEVQNLVTGGGGTNNVIQTFAFFDNTIRDVYIPFSNETENQTIQRYNRWIAPFDGQVEKVFLVSTVSKSGGTGATLEVRKVTSGTNNPVTLETVAFSSMTNYVTTELTFTASSSFSTGDVLVFWLTNDFTSIMSNMTGCILFSAS